MKDKWCAYMSPPLTGRFELQFTYLLFHILYEIVVTHQALRLDVRPYDRPYKVLLLACAANPISVRHETPADDNKVRILECRASV